MPSRPSRPGRSEPSTRRRRRAAFGSAAPYFEFRDAFVYPAEAVALDRHTIVEAGRTRSIYIWTQFFSPQTLAAELGVAGLRISELLGDVAGRPFDPHSPQFAVVARP
jgi:hypothetical protein